MSNQIGPSRPPRSHFRNNDSRTDNGYHTGDSQPVRRNAHQITTDICRRATPPCPLEHFIQREHTHEDLHAAFLYAAQFTASRTPGGPQHPMAVRARRSGCSELVRGLGSANAPEVWSMLPRIVLVFLLVEAQKVAYAVAAEAEEDEEDEEYEWVERRRR
ncbi:uncharacterized protein LTR77_004546 [Saxophila tyrrhenica]|uniref:Uncharacterized protein n=1 Tax=Saxophila tyrrhenica TaxID=1690608 RepID=A0AAV9PGG5_9PEZI|nr:hypothetical protein LTR77_004546 [Saxophila tyrrhenica]